MRRPNVRLPYGIKGLYVEAAYGLGVFLEIIVVAMIYIKIMKPNVWIGLLNYIIHNDGEIKCLLLNLFSKPSLFVSNVFFTLIKVSPFHLRLVKVFTKPAFTRDNQTGPRAAHSSHLFLGTAAAQAELEQPENVTKLLRTNSNKSIKQGS